jgi:serine/threonine protein kinase
MKKYHTQQGEIRLGEKLGHGGEGAVYRVARNKTTVIKIYNDIPRHPHEPERAYATRVRAVRAGQEQKILTMIANPPHDAMHDHGHVSIAWPIDAIYENKQFVGFSMPKVDGFTVHEVLQPQQRAAKHPQWNHHHLYRVARNIATAVAALHRKGYVIGDINFKNILCHDNTLVTLIDCDSMQVRDLNGKLYRCTVGIPEFTPTELQNKNLNEIDRTVDHDGFGIAVLMFELLMQGFHPFQCISKDPSVVIEQIHVHCIERGIFPYVHQSQFVPAPVAPALDVLPGTLRNHFVQAFTKPGQRPSAASWAEIIMHVEQRLVQCGNNPQHYYPSDGQCVLCAINRNVMRLTGKVPVVSTPTPPRQASPRPLPPRTTSTSPFPSKASRFLAWCAKTWQVIVYICVRGVWPIVKWLAINCWRVLVFLGNIAGMGIRQWLWPALKWSGRIGWRGVMWFVWAPGARYRVLVVITCTILTGLYLMPKGYQLWSRVYAQCTAAAMISQQWPMLPPAVLAQMEAAEAATVIPIDGLLVANKTDIQSYRTQFGQCVGDQGSVTALLDATQVGIAHEYVLLAYRRFQFPGMQWHTAGTIVPDIAQAYHVMAPHSSFVHLHGAIITRAVTPNNAYDWLLPVDGHWFIDGEIAHNNRTIHADGYIDGPFSDLQIVGYPTPSRIAVQLDRNDVVIVLPEDAPIMAQYLAMAPFPSEYRVVLIPTGKIYALPR